MPAVCQIDTPGYEIWLCRQHSTNEQCEIVLSFIEYTENGGSMNYYEFTLNLLSIRRTASRPVTGKQIADTEKRLFG